LQDRRRKAVSSLRAATALQNHAFHSEVFWQFVSWSDSTGARFAKLVKSSTRFGEQGAWKVRMLFFCAVNIYA
jgi:hypothetical protein